MLIAYYTHRLPADYDIGIIRRRVRERGPVWDHAPDLYFKAFLLRESGAHGAIAHSYSSLYLWRHDHAFQAFLMAGNYQIVTDSFGRAPLRMRLVLHARRGAALNARFAQVEESDIAPDTDLTRTLADEVARNHNAANRPGVVVSVVGVDTERWRIIRVVLSDKGPEDSHSATVYQVLHLAPSLLHTLEGPSA
jgi:hypothetical protein